MLFRETEIAGLEALLLVAKEPITLERLANILELNTPDVAELLNELQQRYANPACGFTIYEVNGGFKLGTKPEMSHYIETLYHQPTQGLSGAALEVLSIIAYKQPVTKGEIDFLRGVASDRALSTLVEKGLTKEIGRKEGPGRPILYGTTEQFLLHFGLKSLTDLPDLDFEKIREAAREELSEEEEKLEEKSVGEHEEE